MISVFHLVSKSSKAISKPVGLINHMKFPTWGNPAGTRRQAPAATFCRGHAWCPERQGLRSALKPRQTISVFSRKKFCIPNSRIPKLNYPGILRCQRKEAPQAQKPWTHQCGVWPTPAVPLVSQVLFP